MADFSKEGALLGGVPGGFLGGLFGQNKQELQRGTSIANSGDAVKRIMALAPEYQTGLDASGNIKAQYQLDPESVKAQLGYSPKDFEALDVMRQEALGAGPSRYAQALEAKQLAGQGVQRDEAKSQSARAASEALSKLQMRGGSSVGARERLAGQAGRADMEAQQKVGAQGLLQRLGIASEDEQRKSALRSQLAQRGTEVGKAGVAVQEKNIANALEQLGMQNAAEQNKYAQALKAYGADQTAEATYNRAQAELNKPQGLLSRILGGIL